MAHPASDGGPDSAADAQPHAPGDATPDGVPAAEREGQYRLIAELHGGRPDRRRLAIALALASATALVELWGGFVTDSLALLADATHVFADIGALSLALAAVHVARRPHTLRWTFGFHRIEVLAATFNALLLLGLAAFLVWRALLRLDSPQEVEAGGLLGVALLGLLANVIAAQLLGHSESVNVRAARLHVLSDLGGSVVAVSAGALIWLTGWERVDPLLSLVIVALIVFGALRLLRETLAILMARVPGGIDLGEVERELLAIDGVRGVHDMHCWTITTGFNAFACHLSIAAATDSPAVVEQATALLRDRFAIHHATLQPDIERLHTPREQS